MIVNSDGTPMPPDPGYSVRGNTHGKVYKKWKWRVPLVGGALLGLADLWWWALFGISQRVGMATGFTAFGLFVTAFLVGMAQAEGI